MSENLAKAKKDLNEFLDKHPELIVTRID